MLVKSLTLSLILSTFGVADAMHSIDYLKAISKKKPTTTPTIASPTTTPTTTPTSAPTPLAPPLKLPSVTKPPLSFKAHTTSHAPLTVIPSVAPLSATIASSVTPTVKPVDDPHKAVPFKVAPTTKSSPQPVAPLFPSGFPSKAGLKPVSAIPAHPSTGAKKDIIDPSKGAVQASSIPAPPPSKDKVPASSSTMATPPIVTPQVLPKGAIPTIPVPPSQPSLTPATPPKPVAASTPTVSTMDPKSFTYGKATLDLLVQDKFKKSWDNISSFFLKSDRCGETDCFDNLFKDGIISNEDDFTIMIKL